MLANSTALAQVTGAHVWNINSVESVAYEYSRFNYNATNFYAPNPYRSSDHDPLLVGFAVPAPPAPTTTTATVAPKPVVVRDTKPTISATIAYRQRRGGRRHGDVLQRQHRARHGPRLGRHRLPAAARVRRGGSRTVTAEYSGARTFATSSGSVTFDVVKATPTMAVAVQPSVIHKKTTSPGWTSRSQLPARW